MSNQDEPGTPGSDAPEIGVAARPPPEDRWFAQTLPLGTFLAFAMLASTVTMFAVAVLAPHLQRDLGLSTLEVGLFTTIFFVSGALTSPLLGAAVDRLGARRGLLVLFGSCCTSLLILATASSRPSFFAAAVVGGVAAALGNPATNSLLARHLTGRSLASAVGVKQAGVPASLFLAGVSLPPLAMAVGWRGAVAATVPLCLLGAVVGTRLPSGEPVRPPRSRSDVSDRPNGLGTHRPAVIIIAAYVFLLGGGLAAIQTYLVLYAVTELALRGSVAGVAAATLGVTGVLSRIVSPRLVQRLGNPWSGLRGVALGASLATVVLVLARGRPELLFVAAVGLGVTAMSGNAIANFALVTQIPRPLAGRASGTVQTGFYAGMSATPLCIGWVIERAGYVPAWWLATAIFTLAFLVVVIAPRSHHFGEAP